jgi:hypothetical protein
MGSFPLIPWLWAARFHIGFRPFPHLPVGWATPAVSAAQSRTPAHLHLALLAPGRDQVLGQLVAVRDLLLQVKSATDQVADIVRVRRLGS